MPNRPASHPLRALLLAALAAGCSSASTPAVEADREPPRTAPDSPDTLSSANTEGWVWSYRSNPPTALFGPPASEAVLVVECSPEGPGRVQHTVYAPAPVDGSGELVIEGNGDRRSVRVGPMASELAGGPVWSGHSEIGTIERPFLDGEGPVVFRIEGGPTLAVPDPLPVRSLFAACAG
ncbi:hypothetical protein WI460_13790 [Gemmatimonadota bacterium Y43]|uniref:hypothetical protein n=1 Tax=Gaopeijia maritima TaxID=3119007 RepID=UPI0032803AC6